MKLSGLRSITSMIEEGARVKVHVHAYIVSVVYYFAQKMLVLHCNEDGKMANPCWACKLCGRHVQ